MFKIRFLQEILVPHRFRNVRETISCNFDLLSSKLLRGAPRNDEKPKNRLKKIRFPSFSLPDAGIAQCWPETRIPHAKRPYIDRWKGQKSPNWTLFEDYFLSVSCCPWLTLKTYQNATKTPPKRPQTPKNNPPKTHQKNRPERSKNAPDTPRK